MKEAVASLTLFSTIGAGSIQCYGYSCWVTGRRGAAIHSDEKLDPGYFMISTDYL
jgi:hypothetical protein